MLEQAGSDAAEELLEKGMAAPSLWLLEAGNALRRRTVRGELMQAEALALAKRLGTHVVTADTRFVQAVDSHGVHVGHIRVLSRGPGSRM